MTQVQQMGSQRTPHCLLQGFSREVNLAVGFSSRSAEPLATAQVQARRRRLLRFLQNHEPVWKDQDHPELAIGTTAWVSLLRKRATSVSRRSISIERRPFPS